MMHAKRTTSAAKQVPPSPGAAEPLREYLTTLIESALSAGLDRTALFLAERLAAALTQDEASAYLLALSLYRNRLYQGCVYVLRSAVHPKEPASDPLQAPKKPATRAFAQWKQQQLVLVPAIEASLRCAWLYSQACSRIGRPRDGESVLASALDRFSHKGKREDLMQPPTIAVNPSPAAIQLSLAHLALKSNHVDQAAAAYENALKECWWCYEAFEGLCHIGKAPNAHKYFGGAVLPPPLIPTASSSTSSSASASTSMRRPLSAGMPQPAKHSSNLTPGLPPSPLPSSLNLSIDSTTSTSDSSFTHTRSHLSGSGGPASSSSGGFFTPQQPFPSIGLGAPLPNHRRNLLNKDAVRRSTRVTAPHHAQNHTPVMQPSNGHLLLDKGVKNKEPRSRVSSNPRERKRAKGSVSPPVSLLGVGASTNAQEPLPNDPQLWLKTVMARFGAAESALSVYDAAAAIESLVSLDIEQRRSWRACVGIGRARMESLDYAAAEKALNAAREAAPYMLAYGDLHSTLLWHLSRNTDLSYLAQQLMSLDPLAHQSWIASGNVFSLMDDHKNALKCFKRAIQLVEAPRVAADASADASLVATQPQVEGTGEYAYVLAGHECVVLEEWEAALGFYREAIRRKLRTYTAWFGLGNVYMKAGKLRLAEYHFNRASEINPTNAMLVSCVGSVCEKLGRKSEALQLYERAAVLAPSSAAVCFKKCKLLVSMRRYHAALKDLLSLAALASDEWNVHYLLGKTYGALGQQAQMTKHFTFAQDLDPRSAQKIRDAIERVNEKRAAMAQGEMSGIAEDAEMDDDEADEL